MDALLCVGMDLSWAGAQLLALLYYVCGIDTSNWQHLGYSCKRGHCPVSVIECAVSLVYHVCMLLTSICYTAATHSPRVFACVAVPQDQFHLYFLFDLMAGGDLMDVLVAEAKIIKHPVPQKGSLRQGCLAPKVKMWQVRL